MRAAAITGAYGYVGSRIRTRLDDAGWTTIALVRKPRIGDRGVPWQLGEDGPQDALQECDALIHCAYDFEVHDPEEIWRINGEGSVRLLRSARCAGVERLLYVSSMSAYPGTAQVYGRTKLGVEAAALDLGAVCVRPGLVYGHGAGGMAGTLMKLGRLPVVPVPGGNSRQFPVHEDDLAKAVTDILESHSWIPEVVGVAQPSAVTFRDLVAALSSVGRRQPHFVTVPWRLVYVALKVAELARIPLPLRADSLLGLVHPATEVPRSLAFPQLPETVRRIPAD